jgi:pimeloyl-ACP methyl ester carboxylesterase
LQRLGHDVFTPTLAGLGDRSHVGMEEAIGLSTHVADIVELLELEDLREVVLCAASYGGMPATGAADRAPDRVRLLAYIDALVPSDGQSALDLLPRDFGRMVRSGIAENGASWRVPMPAPLWDVLMPADSVPDWQRADYRLRIRAHPASSFAEPIRLAGPVEQLSRAFVRCTGGRLAEAFEEDPIVASAHRARTQGWTYRELDTGHDPQVFDPRVWPRSSTTSHREGDRGL